MLWAGSELGEIGSSADYKQLFCQSRGVEWARGSYGLKPGGKESRVTQLSWATSLSTHLCKDAGQKLEPWVCRRAYSEKSQY
jgi:hypothetical protein